MNLRSTCDCGWRSSLQCEAVDSLVQQLFGSCRVSDHVRLIGLLGSRNLFECPLRQPLRSGDVGMLVTGNAGYRMSAGKRDCAQYLPGMKFLLVTVPPTGVEFGRSGYLIQPESGTLKVSLTDQRG